ncbi:MAG: hypothetical protein EOR43_32255 [Mesorhizobium sp.]|uniref:hypothetical protein n=1 Tax=Mesorhizobium sp. TaxID=1871066 RepID=UPI000FE4343E|nr:hypothetical protein [Mesorhizobium sp.]RWK14790.1 MAG: hypothetical protein EOR43_32255 [Mesorhizobium sp.]RWK32615.1 MAG: hypothetical protein EOR44_10400 [Mesorhizobium sp.]
MLGWLKDKLARGSAEKQVRDQMAAAVEVIKKSGGADRLVWAYVNYFLKNEDKMDRLLNGLLKVDEYPTKRMTISFAAINSIMAARRDLAVNPGDEDAKARLGLAEQAFLLSWLHLEEKDIARITPEEFNAGMERTFRVMQKTRDPSQIYSAMPHRKIADESMQLGREALAKWQATDVRSFKFIVPI